MHSEQSADLNPSMNQATLKTIPWSGLGLILAIMIAEVLLFTMRFDLVKQPYGHYLSWMPQHAGFLVRWLISLTFFVATLGGYRFYSMIRDFSKTLQWKVRWAYFAIHLAFMAVFYASTTYLYTAKGALLSAMEADGLIAIWAIAWLGASASILGSILPYRMLKRFVTEDPALWLFGTIIATLTDQSAFQSRLIWYKITTFTLKVVSILIQLVNKNVVIEPEIARIGTETFSIEIQPSCSGAEGMGMIAIFLSIYFCYCRSQLRFPKVLILLPIGICLSWVLNSFRIFALIEIGIFYSPETALGGFHSQFGWLMFNSIALGLVLVSRTRYFRKTDSETIQVQESSDVLAFAAPFTALLASTMITQALAAGFDIFYPFRILAVGLVLWEFRHHYKEPLFTFSWTAIVGGIAVFVVWMAFENALGTKNEGPDKFTQSLSEIPRWLALLWIFLRAVGSVITVPIAEELVFRGYLLRRLISSDFVKVSPSQVSKLAIVISSAAFGALHSRLLAGIIAGVLYSLIYLRRGRLGEAVTAHAITNLMIAIFAIATGAWSLWN